MRDGIALERNGIPQVTLVHDIFEKAARTQAQVMGMPNLPLVVLPRTRPGEKAEEAWEEAETALPQVLALLTQPPPA